MAKTFLARLPPPLLPKPGIPNYPTQKNASGTQEHINMTLSLFLFVKSACSLRKWAKQTTHANRDGLSQVFCMVCPKIKHVSVSNTFERVCLGLSFDHPRACPNSSCTRREDHSNHDAVQCPFLGNSQTQNQTQAKHYMISEFIFHKLHRLMVHGSFMAHGSRRELHGSWIMASRLMNESWLMNHGPCMVQGS